jgi:putative transposase
MKRVRFTDEQMVNIVSETYTSSIEEVARKHGVSEQVIHNWRQHLSALRPPDARRLQRLERENARLRAIIAERDLGLDMISENQRRREGMQLPTSGELRTR